MTIQSVVFDLNGTLVNDWSISYRGVQAIFHAYEKPCPSIEMYVRHIASNGDYFAFYEAYGIHGARPEELRAIFVPAYMQHVNEVRTMPGLFKTLKEIRGLCLNTHILTAAHAEFADLLIDHCEIREYFDSFHYNTHDKESALRALMQGLGVAPEACVMIGDLPADAEHAKRAGAHGIVLLGKHLPRDVLRQLTKVDYIAFEMRGLISYLLEHAP